MRWSLLALSALLPSCSLVIDQRTDAYEGACADEEEAVNAEYTIGQGDNARVLRLPQIARLCFPCIGEDCIERCIARDTRDAISTECSACLADAAICASTQCPGICVGGDDPRPCEACMCEHGCTEALDECSGLTPILCR